MEKIFEIVDRLSPELIDLGAYLHKNPELAFNEYKAMEVISCLLSKHGFSMEKGVGNLETSFIGKYGEDKAKIKIAYLAEYDALPEIGHGCGHNLIATMAVGAAIALKEVLKGFDAQVLVIGTPAEENGGGKIIMFENGCFQDIDYVMMSHPCVTNMIGRKGTAALNMEVEYFGKSAHSSYPEGGKNALSGLIHTFNCIDNFRSIFPNRTNVNGIIKNGGLASNIIPDYSKGEFSLRGESSADLDLISNAIEKIIESSASLYGLDYKIGKSNIYMEKNINKTMANRFKDNIAKLGIDMVYPDPNMKFGSSDVGNVSFKIPTIHPYIKIGENIRLHSREFSKASNEKFAYEQIIKAIKALALTGYHILKDEEFRLSIDREFTESISLEKN